MKTTTGWQLSEHERAAIASRYADGDSSQALALEYGISRNYVGTLGRRSGVYRGWYGRGRPPPKQHGARSFWVWEIPRAAISLSGPYS
jgi:hypothetical protein